MRGRKKGSAASTANEGRLNGAKKTWDTEAGVQSTESGRLLQYTDSEASAMRWEAELRRATAGRMRRGARARGKAQKKLKKKMRTGELGRGLRRRER